MCMNLRRHITNILSHITNILTPGTMAHFLRSRRKVTEAQIANAEVAKSVGIVRIYNGIVFI
jgi:hypothetical protein